MSWIGDHAYVGYGHRGMKESIVLHVQQASDAVKVSVVLSCMQSRGLRFLFRSKQWEGAKDIRV